MITQELEENINFTHFDARRRRLEAVTVEHLTLVLMDNSSVRRCLAACSADIESLRQDLEHFIESQAAADAPQRRPAPTQEFHRVLQRAVGQLRGASNKASGAHVLAAVFAEPGCRAAYYLKKHGVERLALLAYAGRQPSETSPSRAPAVKTGVEVNLSELAAAGKLEKPFGREREVAELIRVLGRKYKNSPLLVGEPGVGKTAVVHKLAHCAAEATSPPLAGMTVFSAAVGDLVAGTKYRGDFEKKMRDLIETCRARGNAVLFIDEIHAMVGAGAVSGGSLDAANMMKPVLNGGVRCIGATTFAEYRRIFEKDAALSRRFHKIDIAEPDGAELGAILSGVVGRLESHHQVRYAPDAADAAIKHSRRFLPGRFLPDKAIDVLDDAGSRRRLKNHARPKKAAAESPIGGDDILSAAAAAAGLSARAAAPDLSSLGERLAARVIDQPEAAARLAAAVLRRQLGYHDGGGTAGAFLFAGPTGVGKTEMARQLAMLLGAPLLRFDMSEYMEAHSVSRLIGAPPGYVGFEQSGRLAEEIAKHPDAVVLLDEIEKAHPEARNIFLQIMDDGALTDNSGRRADFSSAMLVMTSNAGAEEWERPPPGFGRDDSAAAGSEALSRQFSPEFRNRLDAIVRFAPLGRGAIERILRRRLREIAARMRAEKNIRLTFGRRFRAGLLADGFSPTMGARPLERLLRERVLDSLASAEAAGELPSGNYHLDAPSAAQTQISPSGKKLILAE